MGGNDHCCFFGCKNRRKKETTISFYRFPLDQKRRKLWVEASRRDTRFFMVTEHSKVCSDHFITGRPNDNPGHVDYIPSQKIFKATSTQERATVTSKRSKEWTAAVESGEKDQLISPAKKAKRMVTELNHDIASEVTVGDPAENSITIENEWLMEGYDDIGPDHTYIKPRLPCDRTTEKSTQADLNKETTDKSTQSHISKKDEYVQTEKYLHKYHVKINNVKLRQSQNLVKSLFKENKKLKNELKSLSPKFTAKAMLTDNTKVQFWTGLPNLETFTSLLKYLTPKVNHMQYARGNESHLPVYLLHKKTGKQRKLLIEDEFFAVLVRLKVGLFVTDIAQRLQISESYFSKLFNTWVRFLRLELELLTVFPPLSDIQKFMPSQIANKFPNTRVIIDCTEMYIEKPSELKAQRQTWSNYKHNNTYKILVGITPDGSICYISKLYGGCASDKFITKDCGIIDYLNPGDNVMADRGFDIHDLLAKKGVSLNIPPYLLSKQQMESADVEETRRIAECRIHVERAIQRIKTFHILTGSMPLSLHCIAEDIFKVCAYLTNFQSPIIRI